jgi:hypothetical protein
MSPQTFRLLLNFLIIVPSTSMVPFLVYVAVTFQIFIRDVLGSKLGRDTDYPDWAFLCFLQSLQVNAGIVPRVGQYQFLPNHSQFIIYPIIQCYTYNLDTDSVIKWITHKRNINEHIFNLPWHCLSRYRNRVDIFSLHRRTVACHWYMICLQADFK